MPCTSHIECVTSSTLNPCICAHCITGLPHLIFLDLYNNRIERIQGLDTVTGLRVLMLGKNRLSRIEGLEALPKLDVLDLHCNRIRTIEGLSHLAELVRRYRNCRL